MDQTVSHPNKVLSHPKALRRDSFFALSCHGNLTHFPRPAEVGFEPATSGPCLPKTIRAVK